MDYTKVEQQLINSRTTFAAGNQHVDQLCLLVVTLIHIYIYVYMCTNVYTCVNMCTYVYIYIYMYMCIYGYVCVSVCMRPRPRRLTLKVSASCYYLSIIKKTKYLYFGLKASSHTKTYCFSFCFLNTRPQSNTTAGRLKAARRRVRFRPVGQKAIEK